MKNKSTNLHTGSKGSVDLCYDVDYLPHPGVDRHTSFSLLSTWSSYYNINAI